MIEDETRRIVDRLQALRSHLIDQAWQTAKGFENGQSQELISELVKLKSEIDAIYFALLNCPTGRIAPYGPVLAYYKQKLAV